MVGVLAQDVPQSMARQQLVLVRSQVEDDVGAARGLLDDLHGVAAFAGTLPPYAVLGREARASGDERHPIGDDERGVEAHAELSDEVCIPRAVGRQLRQELARPRLGDGADVVDDVLPGHADAVVRHGDRARRCVVADMDARLGVVLHERAVGHRLEPQLVGGIRGVRDELAQEDLLVAVQGVNHQLQELRDLGLESEGFFRGRACHRVFQRGSPSTRARVRDVIAPGREWSPPGQDARPVGERRYAKADLPWKKNSARYGHLNSMARSPGSTRRHR